MRCLTSLVFASFTAVTLAAGELQPIIVTGDSLPSGTESGILVGIEDIATNRIGNILLYGRVDTGEGTRLANVWFADSAIGSIELLNTSSLDIADEDDTWIRLAPDGAIAVQTDSGVYRYDVLNEPTRIIGDGDPAPGFPEGTTVIDPSSVAFNRTYTSISSDILGGITGAWIMDSDELRLVAQTGMEAPGLAGRVEIPVITAINGNGQFAIQGEVLTESLGSPQSLWFGSQGTAGQVELIIGPGMAAPHLPEGTAFDEVESFTLNESGRLAVITKLAGEGHTAAWLFDASNDLRPLAVRSDAAPGLNGEVTFSGFLSVEQTDTQQTFLRAWSSEGQGIWEFDDAGQPQLVAMQGQTAYASDGTPLLLGSINNLFINELGDVAFEGKIVGISDENRDEAIWSVAASDRKLRMLIQEGDMSAEGMNESFPLTRLEILGVDNTGRVFVSGGNAENDGLFAVAIPEPSSLVTMLVGTMLLFARKRSVSR